MQFHFYTHASSALTALLVVLPFGALAQTPPANECNAAAKLIKSARTQPSSASWTFTFQVSTACEGSSGSFEYEYRVKGNAGSATLRRTQSWKSENGKKFEWTDDVTVGTSSEGEFARFIPGSFVSTKVR